MKQALAVFLLRILAVTWRYSLIAQDIPDRCVVAFWHRDMLAVWKYFAGTHSSGVTSLSKDGDILAALLQHWSYTVIRGSSSKGGKEVLSAMVDAASRGRILITPDGPRGPAGMYKPGAIVCAQRAQVPLVQLNVVSSSYHTLTRSWDRFRIPLPFARIELQLAELVSVPAEWDTNDVDTLILKLQDHTQTNEAQQAHQP